MTSIYEFNDFRVFLKDWLKHQPKSGHGLLGVWAKNLGVHPTLMSQILSGKKELSLEHAEELAHLLHLTEQEADYFLLLIQLARAGSTKLRSRWKRKIEEARKKSQVIAERLKDTESLTEEARGIFYSSWIYSGIRNLTALPTVRSAEDLAKHLQVPRDVIQDIVEFLLRNGLCIGKNGTLDVGPRRTHIPASSPLVHQHHKNWRLEGFQKMIHRHDDDLFFTFPMSLSENDAQKIRRLLPKWIEEVHGIVGPSSSETVRCLNLDFFEY